MSTGDQQPPGLQAERTRLSWRRTTLAATAVALLAVTAGLMDRPTPVGLAAAALLALAWLAILIVAQRRIDALGRGVTATAGRWPAVLALLVTAYALLSTVLII
jgi:Domain of unknown function (DUF202)